MKQNEITELEALQNAVTNFCLTDLKVHEKYFEDKRKTTKMFFLHNDQTGETISPVLDYENLNHFIHGYGKALKLNGRPVPESNKEGDNGYIFQQFTQWISKQTDVKRIEKATSATTFKRFIEDFTTDNYSRISLIINQFEKANRN